MSPSALAWVADGLDNWTGIPVSRSSQFHRVTDNGLHWRWLLDQSDVTACLKLPMTLERNIKVLTWTLADLFLCLLPLCGHIRLWDSSLICSCLGAFAHAVSSAWNSHSLSPFLLCSQTIPYCQTIPDHCVTQSRTWHMPSGALK